MKNFYLLHDDFDGCGVPLFIMQHEALPVDGERWEYDNILCLDGESLKDKGKVYVGPCQHCLAPFSIFAEYLITEEDYLRRLEDFRKTYPGFERYTHSPEESWRYEGNGAEGRILTTQKPFTVMKIKQAYPRVWDDYNVTIHRVKYPRHTLTLDLCDNKQDAVYFYATFNNAPLDKST